MGLPLEFSAGFEVIRKIPGLNLPLRGRNADGSPRPGESRRYRIFNAAFARNCGGYWAIPRVNPKDIPANDVDVTRQFAVMHVSDRHRVSVMRMLPVEEFADGDADQGMEDLRMLRTGGRSFSLAGTVVVNNMPRIGIIKGREPFTGKPSFGKLAVPGHFAEGKNGLPSNSDDTILYRPEGEERTFVFRDAANRLDHGRRIKLPDVWWAENGRFGLTGMLRLPVPDEKENLFDTILHAYRYDGNWYYYALGWARCRARADGTFDVVGIAHDPLMDYDSLSAAAGVWKMPSPQFGKYVVYSDGYDTDGRNVMGLPTLGDETMYVTRITERPKRSTYVN